MQKLTLPMADSRQVVGYKNELYRKAWGFPHYGWDFNSREPEPYIYALGKGTVTAAGFDRVFGYVVVVVYRGCVFHDGSVHDVAARCYHMAAGSLLVKKGDAVVAGAKLGLMGNTGLYTSGPHLHLTLDVDARYPCYEPGLARNGQIIKRGTDSTVDPARVLYIDRSWQRLVNGARAGWNSPEDYNLPRA